METEIYLNQGKDRLTAEKLTQMIADKDMKVVGFWTHTKASESYAILSVLDGGVAKEWYVSYVYRRTNTFIDVATELAEYLRKCKTLLTVRRVNEFKKIMAKQTKHLFGKNSTVTLPIFKKLLKKCGEWVSNKAFNSTNTQRRIQDLKENGFTLSTKIEDKVTYHMLMPFDMVKAPTYETIPPKVRKAIFEALGRVDAYTNKLAARSTLPDHKFPEIRWTSETAATNEGLTENEMRKKFQLVPEYINQAKREVCRGCFQSGCRGTIHGINFFYKGNAEWPADVPKMGKEAEAGCEGCFWYDMAEWRKSLNKLIEENKG